jgi:glutamate synthase domain-containing protein 1
MAFYAAENGSINTKNSNKSTAKKEKKSLNTKLFTYYLVNFYYLHIEMTRTEE